MSNDIEHGGMGIKKKELFGSHVKLKNPKPLAMGEAKKRGMVREKNLQTTANNGVGPALSSGAGLSQQAKTRDTLQM